MNISTANGSFTINGKLYEGKHLQIVNGKVLIDGIACELDNAKEPEISIQVTGDVQLIDGNANTIIVTGSCSSVKTVSGDVSCGDVTGNVQTVSGDVKCGNVGGSIKTVSGDIHKTQP